jgi:hypothetical protein
MSQAPPCSSTLPPATTAAWQELARPYSASYTYAAANQLTSSPLGADSHGASAHVDAATAIDSTWSASYDAEGSMICRAQQPRATPHTATALPRPGWSGKQRRIFAARSHAQRPAHR